MSLPYDEMKTPFKSRVSGKSLVEINADLTKSNRQLREELERVKAAEHPWAKALAKKWLDPECSDGCQSLKHKHRIETLEAELKNIKSNA